MFKEEAKAMFIYPIALILIGLLAALIGPSIFHKKHMSDTYVLREVRERSFSTFITGIQKFPYEAPTVEKKRIISKYHKLRIEMTRDEVLSLLGEPDFIHEEYNKTKGNIFLGWTWSYYLHRHEAERANDRLDQIITIYFDKTGKMYHALPLNVTDLTEKGTPVPGN